MRVGPEQVGVLGLSLLAAAGLAGVGLAVHGYGHGAVIAAGPGVGSPAPVAGSQARSTTGSQARSAVRSHARSRAKSHSTSPPSKGKSSSAKGTSSSAKGTSSSAKGRSSSAKASSQKLGPLLSSTQYAGYSYRIYPGPESSQAHLATAGFTIRVTPGSGTFQLSVSASGSGQAAQTSTFPAGDRVYFIEATYGDESGGTDYNFGDDGVVVTNAHGYLVQ